MDRLKTHVSKGIFLLWLAAVPAVLAAQTAPVPRIALATEVTEAPIIDGRLDDPVWASAEPITGFTQTWPAEGSPASEETLIRVVYTDSAIYIAAHLYDQEPGQILVTTAGATRA